MTRAKIKKESEKAYPLVKAPEVVSHGRGNHKGGGSENLNRGLVLIASRIFNDGARLGAKTHLAGIVSVSFKVRPELDILFRHPISRQRLDKQQNNQSRQKRQPAPDPERPSVPARGGVAAESLDDGWEGPSAHERSNLPNSGGDAVVLPTHGGRSGLGRQETEVVSWPDFSEGEEDAVDDGEGGDVFGQFGVEAAHDESDDGLAD
jgi:hypothetical protein